MILLSRSDLFNLTQKSNYDDLVATIIEYNIKTNKKSVY